MMNHPCIYFSNHSGGSDTQETRNEPSRRLTKMERNYLQPTTGDGRNSNRFRVTISDFWAALVYSGPHIAYFGPSVGVGRPAIFAAGLLTLAYCACLSLAFHRLIDSTLGKDRLTPSLLGTALGGWATKGSLLYSMVIGLFLCLTTWALVVLGKAYHLKGEGNLFTDDDSNRRHRVQIKSPQGVDYILACLAPGIAQSMFAMDKYEGRLVHLSSCFMLTIFWFMLIDATIHKVPNESTTSWLIYSIAGFVCTCIQAIAALRQRGHISHRPSRAA